MYYTKHNKLFVKRQTTRTHAHLCSIRSERKTQKCYSLMTINVLEKQLQTFKYLFRFNIFYW